MLSRITQRLYQATLPSQLNSLTQANPTTQAARSIITSFQPCSPSPLSIRNLSTSIIDSPGRRIVEYFEQHPTIAARSEFMIGKFNNILSEDERHAFKEQLHLNHIVEYSDKHLTRLLAACARSKFGNAPATKWHTFPMQDIQSIPGIGHKYSTSSFIEILNHLPSLITNLHGENSIKILEFGGFGFNDSFLLTKDLEKQGLLVNRFTGVDINQQGTIAASVFNKEVAKIKNHQIINKDIFKYIKEDGNKGLAENCVVAIRFLAVFDPVTINSFFKDINTSLKKGDVFVFNYSLSGDEANRIGAKKNLGYELKENNGMQMLFRKGEHIQTFLTKNMAQELLAKNGFERVLAQEEEILGIEGNELVRGQNDPYPRITEFVIKRN